MAHNVDPMKVLVDPPDTERLLTAKPALDSKSSDPASGTMANPIVTPPLAGSSDPQVRVYFHLWWSLQHGYGQ